MDNFISVLLPVPAFVWQRLLRYAWQILVKLGDFISSSLKLSCSAVSDSGYLVYG